MAYRITPPPEDQNTEQKILEAAERLFLSKGFNRTSTTEIAREAGCNHALVHYYFRTKENLFRNIFEQKMRMFTIAFFSGADEGGTFEERLRRRISRHFEVLSTIPKLPLLVLSDMLENEERIELLRELYDSIPEDLFSSMDAELKEESAKGNIRPVAVRDLILNVISLNVFLFVSIQLFQTVGQMEEQEMNRFISERKEEITETIIRSLRPDSCFKNDENEKA